MQINHAFFLRRLASAGAFCAALVIPVLSVQGQSSGTRSSTTPGSADTTRTTSTADRSTTGSVDREAREFVHQAALSGVKEVRLSRLALERAKDPQVRDFAQMMIRDHGKANSELASLARQQGINVPSSLQIASTTTGMDTSTTSTSTARTSTSSSTTVTGEREATTGSRQPNRAGASAERRDTGIAAKTMDDDFASKEMEVLDAVEELSEKSGADFDRAYLEQMKEDHENAIDLFEEYVDDNENSALASFAQKTLPTLRSHLDRVKEIEENLED